MKKTVQCLCFVLILFFSKLSGSEHEKKSSFEAKKATQLAIIKALATRKDTQAEIPKAPEAYAKCTGCHGQDGKTKALGKSEIISGRSEAYLVTAMNAYKAGTRDMSGMGALMKSQMDVVSNEDIKAIAVYLANIK